MEDDRTKPRGTIRSGESFSRITRGKTARIPGKNDDTLSRWRKKTRESKLGGGGQFNLRIRYTESKRLKHEITETLENRCSKFVPDRIVIEE